MRGSDPYIPDDGGGWTQDAPDAWYFKDHNGALATRQKLKLDNVEVYYWFEENKTSQYGFTLPLGA